MRSSKYTWDIDKREKEADWKRVWWFWTSLTMVHTTYLYKSRLCHPKCQIYMARYIPYGNIKCFQAIGKVLKYFTFHQNIKNHEDKKGYRITQHYIIIAPKNLFWLFLLQNTRNPWWRSRQAIKNWMPICHTILPCSKTKAKWPTCRNCDFVCNILFHLLYIYR